MRKLLPLFLSVSLGCRRVRYVLVLVLQQIRRGWWKQLWHVYEELCLEMHVVCKGISAFGQRLLFPWCTCGNLKVAGKRERDCVRKLMMILLHFRLYKGKKTPLLRKHSICSEPQRCCFICFLLISYYYMQYHSTTGRHFSSVHFLWWNTALAFSSVCWGSGFARDRFFMPSWKHLREALCFLRGVSQCFWGQGVLTLLL